MTKPIGVFCDCKNFIPLSNFKILMEDDGIVINHRCDLCCTTTESHISLATLIKDYKKII